MRLHFIAIGGSAMHSLAIALQEKGDKITGSDDEIFDPSKSLLESHGLLPQAYGWFPEKITENIDAVILGMHAKADNPELLKAKELGLNIYSYPEFLYEHSKEKTRVVIGGSHGKTSITAMILHVLHYHQHEVDYMLGAQIDNFENSVHLTETNDFILLEGDEYLSSVLDPRPKFHLYQPNIALLSGIAWDHINVFPTFENYIKQFELFLDSMTNGSTLVYNAEDENLAKIAEEATKPTRKHPYQTPEFTIEDGVTLIETPEGVMPLEIFGKHNLQNLAGAKWICQHMGVDENDFYEAMASFKGASKRLELMHKSDKVIVYKDYAHSPSKVQATTAAVKKQYPNRHLIACLELHTYSSLNSEFLDEYKSTLDAADEAIVFFSPKAVEIKRLDILSKEAILDKFKRKDLQVFTSAEDVLQFLDQKEYQKDVLLMMSSGHYGGFNFKDFSDKHS
ncbi:UDP-N-acetylmuramate--L-alanine ligase [Psychroflexus halocasei]|uniref:UDP-N-acetylmuramate: L-alanyl-gamma-D-glutamyl-meso-diaminopimelate ligase n=1 Tax=Psychroflexus halocasei TaxID=908615 RepID=A0A1H3VIE3_9FLAO|nr:Mur ligase family protein [Psychroflexus halocasei]SDZ74545.1 UDP-N-acetylmuramate: L-alanyl-gamma-D-glutamyl-meso-diaminopimelate ligase [Psychroflexus halocasei]